MANKICILLADDHVVLREATAELIENQPDMHIIGQSGTGEETIALTKSLHPDVIVLDIAMPRIDGLEATRQILAESPETKILVLSAHQDADHVIPLLEAGALSYLPKTVSLNELIEAIRATARGESILPPTIASVVVKRLAGRQGDKGKDVLTHRELEVLKYIARGLTNDQIAQQLNLSTRTIEAHLTHIYNKLSVSSRTEAAMVATRKGWISS